MPAQPKAYLPLHPSCRRHASGVTGGEGGGEGGVQETARAFSFAPAPLTQPSPPCGWRGLVPHADPTP